MSGLTPQMQACLRAIEKLSDEAVPPSYSRIQAELGLASRGNVNRLIRELSARGYVTYQPGKHHSVQVIKRNAADLKSKLTAELLHMRAQIDAELVARS